MNMHATIRAPFKEGFLGTSGKYNSEVIRSTLVSFTAMVKSFMECWGYTITMRVKFCTGTSVNFCKEINVWLRGVKDY